MRIQILKMDWCMCSHRDWNYIWNITVHEADSLSLPSSGPFSLSLECAFLLERYVGEACCGCGAMWCSPCRPTMDDTPPPAPHLAGYDHALHANVCAFGPVAVAGLLALHFALPIAEG